MNAFLGFRLHQTCRCTETDPDSGRPHTSQLDYVAGAFFNEFSQCVYMASRGAGKSYSAAIVCLLDAWFKPGIKVCVIGFERKQSDYIFEYLVGFLDAFSERLGATPGGKSKLYRVTGTRASFNQIKFQNGSLVRFYNGGKGNSAGHKGWHPQVLICDEGDLFTRSMFDGMANGLEATKDYPTRFDCLSTNYTVSGEGVILRQIEAMKEFNRTLMPGLLPARIFRTCLIDTLEKCGDEFRCYDEKTEQHCPLWSYCRGKAKEGEGFTPVKSALTKIQASGKQSFESQMLLLRPTSEYSYFHNFSAALNVAEPDLPWDPGWETFIGWDFGGSRCPHASLVVQKDDKDNYRVLDEFLGMGQLEHVIEAVKRKYPRATEFRSFCDPKGRDKMNNQGAQSYVGTLQQHFIYPRFRQLKRRQTFENIFHLIEPAVGPTKLKINARCKNLIAQIVAAEHEASKGLPTPEPSDKILPDDLLDCLRYVVGWTLNRYGHHSGPKWFSI